MIRSQVAAALVLVTLAGCSAFVSSEGYVGTRDTSNATDAGSPVDSSTAVDGSAATSRYHAAVAADGPVVHFPLEETSGPACASTTTTSAVCLYPSDNAIRAQPGVGGTKALRLDAATSKLTVTGLPGNLSEAYSYEVWIRIDAAQPHLHIGNFMNLPVGAGAGDGFNLFLYLDARVRTETWMSGSIIAYGLAPKGLTSAVWHHLVITHSAAPHTDLFYVDGTVVESDTTKEASPRPMVTNALELFGFIGFVDEIAFYDKTLGADRIAAHYAAQ